MIQYALLVDTAPEERPLAWEPDLSTIEVMLYRARREREAVAYCKAYPLAFTLVRVEPCDDNVFDLVAAMNEAMPEDKRIPVLGIHRGGLTKEVRVRLRTVGINTLLHEEDPGECASWMLQTLIALQELRRFEQSKMDVSQLAAATREKLHDISQPLSAIQGRLQLMAAKEPNGSPYHEHYRDMLQQMTRITTLMVEIQQINRANS